jgi:hypothetical protein
MMTVRTAGVNSQRRLIGAAIVWAGCAAAPSGALAQDAAATCSCPELLDALATKIEANYPGYHLEVKGHPREDDYRRHRSAMRVAAESAGAGIDCLRILQAYVVWFEDGHIFVGGRPRVSTAEDTARLRDAAPRVAWTETDVLHYLESRLVAGTNERPNGLDAVEGIWLDPAGLKIAVVRQGMDAAARASEEAPGRFIGFILTSSVEGWQPGDVKVELTALPDGSYDVIIYDDVRARTRPHVYKRGHAGGGRLQRDGLLFHMPPTTWGKAYPVRPGQEGLIDAVDPRAPTARITDTGAVVFHVPSHVPVHARRLRSLVEQYRGALQRAETLIIDLRGNEGGSTFVTDVLMPFLVTPDKRPARYLADGASAVLASADNIAYFERASWAPAGLVARLRAAEPGSVVAFADPPHADREAAENAPSTDTATTNPRNVAILTDAMTVSAAEAFVLKAMRNTKVTLFGEPTGSSIDYQTVGIVGFGCRNAGLYVGYPTIIGSDMLPQGGVRPSGIVPDVSVDESVDPIPFILEYYERNRERERER